MVVVDETESCVRGRGGPSIRSKSRESIVGKYVRAEEASEKGRICDELRRVALHRG
jgi:hypothetical protein